MVAWMKVVPRSGGMQGTSLEGMERTQGRKESSRPTTEGDDTLRVLGITPSKGSDRVARE